MWEVVGGGKWPCLPSTWSRGEAANKTLLPDTRSLKQPWKLGCQVNGVAKRREMVSHSFLFLSMGIRTFYSFLKELNRKFTYLMRRVTDEVEL